MCQSCRENIIESNKKRNRKKNEAMKGCRIIDAESFAKDMWCKDCKVPLSLRDTQEEKKSALSSIITVKCWSCSKLFEITTSPMEQLSTTRPTYNINSRLVIGTIESGIGVTHLNKILSAADLPIFHPSTYKRYERKVGVAIESLAKTSCLENIKIEKELTIEKEGLKNASDWTQNSIVELTISYDAGWQKRGSGRCYNSTTGHGTAIGFYSGKVLGYATRNKRCTVCEYAERYEENNNVMTETKNKHDCRRNFEGSSKAMEADMAREIFIDNPDFIEASVRLGTLIGDDDSSTIATLRREAGYDIKKLSDKNHAVSKLSKCLYAVQLPTNLVKYFKYCFSCVLVKNKNNTSATKAGLLNIVPHAFDSHEECGDWCTYTKDPINYRHKLLPGGKGLTGDTRRQKLQTIFQTFANNAEKLSPCSSSQANESMNRTIVSTAPKHLHYGGSSSNDIRVAAAIVHKNIGNTSIVDVTNKLKTPLSESSLRYRVKLDEMAQERKRKAETLEFKKRRRQLSDRSSRKRSKTSTKEGICYQSGCGFDLGMEFIDQPMVSLLSNAVEDFTIVYFDLETTGFGKSKEIVQIAAAHESATFDAYVMPTREISAQASDVTGLVKRSNVLYLHNEPVISLTEIDAMEGFFQFLNKIEKKIILVAHNCFSFDSGALIDVIQRLGLLSKFTQSVIAFADTLPLFKIKLKNKRDSKASYKQNVLAEEYLGTNASVGAHNAVNDVKVLQQLVTHPAINIEKKDIFENSKTVNCLISKKNISATVSCFKRDLQIFNLSNDKENGRVSSGMITKIVAAGITLDNLFQVYKSSGEKGINILLAQDIGGKPRVSKNKKVISDLCKRISFLCRK
ncbi:uncharacterized protein [Venturia canescens]|uniref:uncharacterized protein isoform X1 n=1 Tax=Venturia canescens TaxID=32260 RepID=UPI001C9D50F3|nr:uncharacterized protein LOC122419082 isoform X1 [Venturia canescens]XP_043289286.1 uncharacterized protein LOC122419083 isoform X2 [Venturia canescens]